MNNLDLALDLLPANDNGQSSKRFSNHETKLKITLDDKFITSKVIIHISMNLLTRRMPLK